MMKYSREFLIVHFPIVLLPPRGSGTSSSSYQAKLFMHDSINPELRYTEREPFLPPPQLPLPVRNKVVDPPVNQASQLKILINNRSTDEHEPEVGGLARLRKDQRLLSAI